MLACCPCELLINAMDLLAILRSALADVREEDRVRHAGMALFRQRIYQIVAGYEDVTMLIAYVTIRHFRFLRISFGRSPRFPTYPQSLGKFIRRSRLGVRLNEALFDQFIRLCGKQVRKRGEILLDIDSTDDPTHGQQKLSFFNGAYDQHMYHPMLIFERHTGCLLSARLRPGNASSHARIVPMLLRLVPRLEAAFPGVPIKLRGDAGFALPLLYDFCEFFGIQYAIGIAANSVFQHRAEPLQKKLKRRYRRSQLPQRSFSSFHHRA